MKWQAGIRQQAAPLGGFEPDKSTWGWNWLERWMAVRPWENRFLDFNLRDDVTVQDNGPPPSEGKNGNNKPQVKVLGKKHVPSKISAKKLFDGLGSYNEGDSSEATMLEVNQTMPTKAKAKPNGGNSAAAGAKFTRVGIGSRSHSNPNDRLKQSSDNNKQLKKHLSLSTAYGICSS